MKDFVSDKELSETKLLSNSTQKHIRISDLFDNLLNGIVLYSHKIFGMDNNHLTDENIDRIEEKYTQMQTRISENKEPKLDNSLQSKVGRKKSKQLALLEVRAELAQIKQNKKKFLKFWKKQG